MDTAKRVLKKSVFLHSGNFKQDCVEQGVFVGGIFFSLLLFLFLALWEGNVAPPGWQNMNRNNTCVSFLL